MRHDEEAEVMTKEALSMETWEWIVLILGVVLLVALALEFVHIRRRRTRLRARFRSEYDRAASADGVGTAEKRLAAAEREHGELSLRSLPSAARERYLDEWRLAETRFVSDPSDAARAAERIVERVLEERGYPAEENVEHSLELLAVDHPAVVERYRHGHAMMDASSARQTEDLRKAMLDFRSVLEELLQDGKRAAA